MVVSMMLHFSDDGYCYMTMYEINPVLVNRPVLVQNGPDTDSIGPGLPHNRLILVTRLIYMSTSIFCHFHEHQDTKFFKPTASFSLKVLTLKQLGIFFKMCVFYFPILFPITVIFLYEIAPIQCTFSPHCGYQWPGALAPGHQYLQCWVSTHAFAAVYELTHWGRDKIDAISQTTFSNAFSWMKMLELRLKFHWSLFPRVQLTISQHWFR